MSIITTFLHVRNAVICGCSITSILTVNSYLPRDAMLLLCCCCCFLLYTTSAISICVVDCLKPGLDERLFEAGCTDSRSSTTALPCLQLENSQHWELSKCWAWILNLLLPIMVLVSKGFVSWMMLFNAG